MISRGHALVLDGVFAEDASSALRLGLPTEVPAARPPPPIPFATAFPLGRR